MNMDFLEIFGNRTSKEQKPRKLIPWMGSKEGLLDQLWGHYPEKFNNYYEPFAGGLSVAFDLKYTYPKSPKEYHFNDCNDKLINFYRQIVSDDTYDYFIDILRDMEVRYNMIDTLEARTDFFYDMRKDFNIRKYENDTEKAVLFYFLIQRSFQHMWRENSKGEFNLPFRNDMDNLNISYGRFEDFHDMFHDAEFCCMDFKDFINSHDFQEGDFIYFDPPYDETFNQYNKDNFNEDNQRNLAVIVKSLVSKGCYCLVSNNKTELIQNLYKDYKIIDIFRGNKFQRVGNNKDKSVLECLIKTW